MQLIALFVGEMLGRSTASAGGLSDERNVRRLGLVLKLQLISETVFLRLLCITPFSAAVLFSSAPPLQLVSIL